MRVRIRDLDSATYVPHPLHRGDAVWHEKNCYVDLYIELLHAMGFEPLACLPFTMRIDLEGDQWTFFKFPLADLRSLFGIEVFELNIWHSLIEHTRAELALGRPVIVDMDSFHLPDARGTDYRTNHVKTSIGVQDLDIEARSLGYFHNAGYHSLAGEDFDNVFRLDPTRFGAEHLAPYVEVVKLDDARRPDRPELVRRSLELLASHLERAPRENPFARYRERFVRDLEWLRPKPLEAFHQYAFATLRQVGANFELAASYVRWLQVNGEGGLDNAATAFDEIASAAKTLQFKTARAVTGGKPLDAGALLTTMEAAWARGLGDLTARYGRLQPAY